MIRKKINYIKGFILFALFSILAFSPLCFIGAHAYHEDSNGNLVSDNLLNYSDVSNTVNGITYDIQNGVVTLNGTATGTVFIVSNQSFISGTYTWALFNSTISYDTNLSPLDNNLRIELRSGIGGVVVSSQVYFDTINKTKTFDLSSSTDSVYIRIGTGASFDNFTFKPMFVSGNVAPTSYESYGSVYYSQSNYDNAYYRNYGLLGYCSKITVQINADPVINDEWNGIQELLYDKSYITMNNNVFNINWSSFNMDYTNGTTYYTSWKFYFDNTYPSVGLYNSFTSTIVNGNYQLVSSNVDLLSYGSIPSGDSVDFSAYSNYMYGRFDWNCSTPGIASNWASLYFTNTNSNDYINGYNDGKNDGIDYATNNVDVYSASYQAGNTDGYSDGYRDGQDYANTHVDIDSASYQAGVSSQGGYNAGYSAGYAKGRTDQSYITNTNTQGNDLIWTIASTPWESFKNIWNVNVLGINLANLVTGFITAIILLWIIKRFWK